MDMPEVTRCFGTFPPKHATYLIALFGLGSGGVGLAGIILYGIIENALLVYVLGRRGINVDESLKKAVLLTIGLSSLLLTVGNALLFLGATTQSRGALSVGVYTLLAMCLILLFGAISAPVSCFFFKTACLIKKISTATMVLSSIVLTIFIEVWLYFLVVAHNYLIQL
ncbi:uncharacterized protein LOC113403100 [Vanessa tameamea]|uniref:Uncharacterized protein LOC113403100 n=1 Tax=Vanessa tameamea TaxID=334116 RepID=A0A8B8IQC2_VANTA|nr:uncharacterized protein LOC113403100 [Vanessa tameamea]